MKFKSKMRDISEIRESYFQDSTNKIMHDTRWDWTRNRTIRIALIVVITTLLICVNQGFWQYSGTRPIFRVIGFLSVAGVIACFLLLRLSIRSINDIPTEFIDEREMKIRDRAFFHAYKILDIALSIVFTVLLLNYFLSGNFFLANIQWSGYKFMAVFLPAMGFVSALPVMSLAWIIRNR